MKAWVVVLALVACKKDITYEKSSLPGFSLELPSSVRYHGDPKTGYATGKISDVTDRWLVFVTWQVGSIVTPEEMPMAVDAIRPALPILTHMTVAPAQAVEISGQKATRLATKVEDIDVEFDDVTCGARSILIGLGARADFHAFRDRVLGSFRCQPDPALEATLADAAPIGVDDPQLLAGWKRLANDDAFAMTNGKLVVLAVAVPNGGKLTSLVDKMIPSLFQSAGATWQETGREHRAGRELQRGTMTADGDQTPGVIATSTCDNGEDALLVLALASDDAGIAEVSDLIVKLRCARPGDPPLPIAKK